MEEAEVLKSLGPDDLFVAVMGVTGSGKSTFISHLTTADVDIGHGLESCTKVIRAYAYRERGRKLWLVDTPGFDDTVRPDIDVLEDLAFWLKHATQKKFKLLGIVHLHKISDVRMGGASYKDLKMFQKFCGTESLPSVVLGTTMWPETPSEREKDREKDLKTKFYHEMINDGATMMRHQNTKASGMKIISHLLDRYEDSKPMVLAIQKELSPEGATLLDTGAGKELDAEKIKIRESFEQKLRENEERLRRAMDEKDQEITKIRLDQRDQLLAMLEQAKKNEEDTRARLEAEMQERFEEKNRMLLDMQKELSMRGNSQVSLQLDDDNRSLWSPPPSNFYANGGGDQGDGNNNNTSSEVKLVGTGRTIGGAALGGLVGAKLALATAAAGGCSVM